MIIHSLVRLFRMPKDCIEDDIFRYLNSYLSIFLHKKIDFPFRMYDVKSMWIDDCLLNSLRSWEKSCRKKMMSCLWVCVNPKVFFLYRDVITAQFKRLLSYLTTDQGGVYSSCITCSDMVPRFLQSCTREHPNQLP